MDRILFSCSESQPAYYGTQWMDFSFSTSKDDNGDDDTICSYCYYYLCENRISVSCRTRHCCRRRFKYCDVFSFPGSMSDAIFGSASCAFFAIFIFSHSVDDATNKHSDFMCAASEWRASVVVPHCLSGCRFTECSAPHLLLLFVGAVFGVNTWRQRIYRFSVAAPNCNQPIETKSFIHHSHSLLQFGRLLFGCWLLDDWPAGFCVLNTIKRFQLNALST